MMVSHLRTKKIRVSPRVKMPLGWFWSNAKSSPAENTEYEDPAYIIRKTQLLFSREPAAGFITYTYTYGYAKEYRVSEWKRMKVCLAAPTVYIFPNPQEISINLRSTGTGARIQIFFPEISLSACTKWNRSHIARRRRASLIFPPRDELSIELTSRARCCRNCNWGRNCSLTYVTTVRPVRRFAFVSSCNDGTHIHMHARIHGLYLVAGPVV